MASNILLASLYTCKLSYEGIGHRQRGIPRDGHKGKFLGHSCSTNLAHKAYNLLALYTIRLLVLA